MTLLALLLALVVERLAAQLLHLREAAWLEGYARWALGRSGRGEGVGCIGWALLPALPVALVSAGLAGTGAGGTWAGLAFAALVLVFSLGPVDLWQELGRYLRLEAAGDGAGATEAARGIIEHDAAQRRDFRAAAVEDAVFVQANNRIFGVLFWFVALGPTGLGPAAAWLFRSSDVLRREAIRRADPLAPARGTCAERLHYVLAWIPARLLALGYALAGSFEDARRSWRERHRALPAQLFERNDWLLVHVGRAALGVPAGSPVQLVPAAMRLVQRALLAWLTLLALLSLAAWIA